MERLSKLFEAGLEEYGETSPGMETCACIIVLHVCCAACNMRQS